MVFPGIIVWLLITWLILCVFTYSWIRKICWRRNRLPTPVFLGFPCGSAGKESTRNVGDLGSIPGLGRSPGEGKGYPFQCSGLEHSMDCRKGHNWVTFTFTHNEWISQQCYFDNSPLIFCVTTFWVSFPQASHFLPVFSFPIFPRTWWSNSKAKF